MIEVIHNDCIELLKTEKRTLSFDYYDSPKPLGEVLIEGRVLVGDSNNESDWKYLEEDFRLEIKEFEFKLSMMRKALIEFEELSKTIT